MTFIHSVQAYLPHMQLILQCLGGSGPAEIIQLACCACLPAIKPSTVVPVAVSLPPTAACSAAEDLLPQYAAGWSERHHPFSL